MVTCKAEGTAGWSAWVYVQRGTCWLADLGWRSKAPETHVQNATCASWWFPHFPRSHALGRVLATPAPACPVRNSARFSQRLSSHICFSPRRETCAARGLMYWVQLLIHMKKN